MDDRPGPKKHVAVRTALLVVQVAVLLGAAYFIWDRAGDLLADFRADDIRGREGWLVASALLYAAFYAILAWHWQLVARSVDPAAHARLWLTAFASQPFKYLPSSLFMFSFRAKYAHDLGFSLKRSTKAQLIENGNFVTAALVLSGWLFALGWGVAAAIAATLVLTFAIGTGLAIERTVRVPKLGAMPVRRETALLLVCMAAWAVAGVAFWAVLQAFGSSVGLVPAIAINALAFAAGIIAVFAPGGLGVRELVFAANGIANPPVVLWRLVTLVVDVVVGLAGIVAVRVVKSAGQRRN
jgi:uncharacterized membrane protein YbhN (UPF0104 family)